jgi:AAA ATPase domain
MASTGEDENTHSRPARPQFVGRERELSELRDGLADATSGQGRRGGVFLISGEPGIGKTRLADELAAEAASRGMQVVRGRCWEGGGAPAYLPWVDVLRSLILHEPRERERRSGSIGFEHSRQNFARGGFSLPHELHRRANGDAHSIQNLALSGLSAPHFEQRMINGLRSRTPKYRGWAGEFIDANRLVKTPTLFSGLNVITAACEFWSQVLQGGWVRPWYLGCPEKATR